MFRTCEIILEAVDREFKRESKENKIINNLLFWSSHIPKRLN